MNEILQGSDAWRQMRLGRVTASRISDIMARTKTGWSTSRANYAAELLIERLTGIPVEGFKSAAMQWGTDNEPYARKAYDFYCDADVEQVAFVPHPTIPMSGASPDGLVGTDGVVEFKCPLTATHLETLLGASIPAGYMQQMQWIMACTGRAWVDFASFDPRLPESMRLHVQRVKRDPVVIDSLEREVKAFLAELDAKIDVLRAKYVTRAAA